MLYGRASELRIFISSRMGTTLDRERRVAAAVVRGLPGHRPWLWEDDAAAGAAHSEHECIAIAGASDGLILLLDQDLSPITEAEYRAAKTAGAQRYVMIREPEELDDHAKTFVDAERRGSIVSRNFANEDELRSHLHQSMVNALVAASRESLLSRRTGRRGGRG